MVPEGTPGSIFSPTRLYTTKTRLQNICNRVFIWQEMKEQNLPKFAVYQSVIL